MTADLEALWHEAFDSCSVFVRDTTLPPGFLEKYQVGLLLREPTFCDASYKLGGFAARHRFLIISSHAKCLDEITPQPWGLCIWQRDSFFKVIDRTQRQELAQITLLEIPPELITIFSEEDLNALEQSFAEQARQTFENSLTAEPVPELNTDEWRQRLVYPIGIDAEGNPFPLNIDSDSGDGGSMSFEIVGTSPLQADDKVETADDIRRGDIVGFEWVSADTVVMRALSQEEADEWLSRKYRIDRGSKPGVFQLTEITD